MLGMKSIWVLAVVLAFVAGSIMTGTMASAASNAQGAPFKQLQDQIDIIMVEIEALPSAADILDQVLDEITDDFVLSDDFETRIQELIDDLNLLVITEETARIDADIILQEQIDDLILLIPP